jgi:hypothetical protein
LVEEADDDLFRVGKDVDARHWEVPGLVMHRLG